MNAMKLFAASLLLSTGAFAADSPEFSGPWNVTVARGAERSFMVLQLEEKGGRYVGTSTGSDRALSLSYSGSLDGARLRLTPSAEAYANLIAAPKGVGSLELTLRKGQLLGAGKLYDQSVELTGARPDGKKINPQIHDFVPSSYISTMSSRHEPVLRIRPGDSVRTSTVDANGLNADRQWASFPGNPHTGPFFIEGAAPGDTLVVHLTKVRVNQDRAEMSCRRLHPNALPAKAEDKGDPTCDWIWILDQESGTARPANPSSRLKELRVPLRPMVGSIGVAPALDEAISTGDVRFHGGNMDYNEIVEGTIVYFPVFQHGALFSLGDGHAAQGDGEVTGQGLETSLAVEFKVDLIKGKALKAPWAESDEYVMFSGVGNSMNDALHAATGGIVEWLQDRYQLSTGDVAMVLGTSLEYEVAEVVDPRPHLVAKLRKDVLAQIASGQKQADAGRDSTDQ